MIKKQYDNLIGKYGAKEVAANFILPVKLESKEKKQTDTLLADTLAKRRDAMGKDEQLRGALLQLRFQIEDYLDNARFDERKTFGYFLKRYIDNLKSKQSRFANEINIKPTELSLYINNHRTPTQNVIIRLELHSHNIISASDWYRLLEKQKLYELTNNKELRREQKKFVKREAQLY
jgi:plasmid maintenance system antidote protein VapI